MAGDTPAPPSSAALGFHCVRHRRRTILRALVENEKDVNIQISNLFLTSRDISTVVYDYYLGPRHVSTRYETSEHFCLLRYEKRDDVKKTSSSSLYVVYKRFSHPIYIHPTIFRQLSVSFKDLEDTSITEEPSRSRKHFQRSTPMISLVKKTHVRIFFQVSVDLGFDNGGLSITCVFYTVF